MKVRNIIVAAGVIGILFALQFPLMQDNRDLRAESRGNFEELEDELAEWASRTKARLDSLFEER